MMESVLFVFSKLVWIVAQPFSVGLVFCFGAFLCVLLRKRRLGLSFLIVAICISVIALFTTTGAVLVQALEDRFPRSPGDPSDLSCMIVLGGGFSNDVDTARGGYNLNDAGDRFVEVVRLAHKFTAARIVVSGGDGFITGGFLGDAVIAGRMFSAFDISSDRILQDKESRTTFENAINTKKLLTEAGLAHCLLITSGFHMPRSIGIFRKLGVDVIPWVVDYRSTGNEHIRFDISQPEANAALLAVAMKEWIGMVGYYASGRTSSLYPGPP